MQILNVLIRALGASFLTLTLSALSACKTGNFSEETVSLVSNAPVDIWSGYYRTEAQDLKLCANFWEPAMDTHCVQVSPKKEWLPEDFVKVLANPIAFVLENATSTNGVIVDPVTYKQTQLGMGAQFERTTNGLGISYQTRYKFLSYTKCIMTDSGFTDSANDGVSQIHITDDRMQVNGFTTRGTLDLKMNFTRVFETLDNSDQCRVALKDAQDCFEDQSVCGGATDQDNEDLHQLIIFLFGAHIDAGALKSSEIQYIKSVTSKAIYR
jgi:hypothetical protein